MPTGSPIGIYYVDYFPRPGKSQGAWMEAFRPPTGLLNSTPVLTNVCNFTKPTGETPALLTFDEVQTLFHEFGHALHGLLSQCTYPSVAGTNVYRDLSTPFSNHGKLGGRPGSIKSVCPPL